MAAWPPGPTPLTAGLLKLLPLEWIAKPPSLHADLAAELPEGGRQGSDPIHWWAAGMYSGRLRQQVLYLRTHPNPAIVAVLVQQLAARLGTEPWTRPPLLVAIPSWKRRANPLPGLLGRALSWQLGWRQVPLLQRSRAVLGQHHLGRELRWANQAGSFHCSAPGRQQRYRNKTAVVLLDDILTTGATACAAADTLRDQGWQVAGMACLARTPWQVRDLRLFRRLGDGPG
jgi:predicted amidophosphoribosyltransferase